MTADRISAGPLSEGRELSRGIRAPDLRSSRRNAHNGKGAHNQSNRDRDDQLQRSNSVLAGPAYIQSKALTSKKISGGFRLVGSRVTALRFEPTDFARWASPGGELLNNHRAN